MTDTKDTDNDKGYMTPDELLADIRKTNPDYMPKNVVRIKPLPDAKNIVPIEFDDLKSIIIKPMEYVFYPCLPVQGLAFIYAGTGLGKTLFALNLAYAIAAGGNFLKYSCPKPRKVLYIDGEMAFNQIHSRLMQIKNKQGELDNPKNFSLLTPDKVLPFRMPKIDSLTDQQIYEEIIAVGEYEVIVFDSLSMLSSFDENKSNEWIIVQDWLLKLRSFGKTVIVIHHAGKDKSGYRGTSRMLDCVDVAISLQPIKEESLEEEKKFSKKFKVVYEKARIFGDADVLPFEVILENNDWTYQSLDKNNLEKVVEMRKAAINQRDIAKELLISQTTVFKLIKKAKEKGLLPM